MVNEEYLEQAREVIEYEDNEDFDGKVMTRISYGCPECLQTVLPYQHRCHNCEQLLKW